MACGAGMPSTAIVVTVLHVIALMLFTPVVRRLEPHRGVKELEVILEDSDGGIAQIMNLAAEKGYVIELKSTTTNLAGGTRTVSAKFVIQRGPKIWKFAEELSQIPGVAGVQMSEKTG